MTGPEIPFLDGLDAEAVAAVRARMVPVAVAGGSKLFVQGEAGDALYTLVSGAIGISADATRGSPRRIARLRPPESFGEMALLSPAPRSATATALRDSRLLRLTRADFEEVIEHHPRMLLYFARLLTERMRATQTEETVRHTPCSVAVLAVTEGLDAAAFGHALARAFDDTMTGKTGCLTRWPDGADEAWFHAYETAHTRTIFVAHEVGCPWCRLCLRHADHVLLLAEPGRPPRPGAAAWLGTLRSDWIRMDFAVPQDADAVLPRPLHPDVAALPAALRIPVRAGNAKDLGRLARLASGSALGLVLGGGGARGLAHLGVLQALEEAGYAPDFVGGTSMGAVVAASLAMDLGIDRIRTRTVDFFVGHNPLNDYTLPYHALTRGAKVDAGLAAWFGGARIEDLWLPFLCVSSNLTTGSAMVHRSGDLPGALRASIAIPGLLPPVCTEEGVLVDGGMMNNLPADVMAGLERGPVLAIDVGSDRAFGDMPARSWRGRMIRRMLGVPYAMPGIAPLLLRAATVSSDAQSMMAVGHAAALLKPPLAGIDLRAWASFEAIAGIGYRHTREAIADGRLRAWTEGDGSHRP
ncbi:patatin-like phospholipase family protein [Methylobacterium marchantiae]|uniref:Patatin-like phospholipase family protein n=1 Tax=Methylobacterium marchantiae TaxID=600331 RepID=A0ABW3X4C0_9HYPH|nr:putative NTE family protein [Methylobacterium marchantiae]